MSAVSCRFLQVSYGDIDKKVHASINIVNAFNVLPKSAFSCLKKSQRFIIDISPLG